MLTPLPGRVMNISAAQAVNVGDSANQSLALSTFLQGSFTANTFAAGNWTVPGQNQAIVFESMRFTIVPQDNSGKLQILAGFINLGDPVTTCPGVSLCPEPYTFPAASGVGGYVWTATLPVPLLVPRPLASANGPLAIFYMNNTDAAGAHTYRRNLAYTYRVIDGVDFSSGAALGGGGIGQ